MSNLPPVAQQAYVCLQCRSRLAAFNITARRAVTARAKRSPLRDFSTQPTSLEQFASVDENPPRNPEHLESTVSPGESTSQEYDDIKLPNDGKKPKAPYAFKRAHLYSKDDLGVTTLGKRAEVLRLRDLPDRHKPSKWWLTPDPDNNRLRSTEPLTAADILQGVISERGIVSTARVIQNIEQLKQDWLSSLEDQSLGPTASECYRLRRQLYHGFTTKQLSGYLREIRLPKYRNGDVLDLSGPFISVSFTRSEWRLGTTPFPGDAAQRLQSIANDGKEQDMTPAHSASTLLAESRRSGDPFKHVQVNEIMQICWHIRPREELDSVGEVDIAIPEAHLELLVSHSTERNILQQLAAEYEVKIDFSKSEHIIRLTANQAICSSSLKLLLMVLDDIVCNTMDLREDGSLESEAGNYLSLPNDDALREIERLSSTVIRRSKNKHAAYPEPHKVDHFLGSRYVAANQSKLLVYSMKNDEDSLDDAQRLVRQLCRPSRSGVTSAFYGGCPVTSNKPNLVPVVRTVGLPMTDQETEWNRISTGSGKQQTQGRVAIYALEAMNGIREHLENSAAVSSDRHRASNSHWHPSLSRESSVMLGRILYPAKTMNSIKRERYFLDALQKRHIFDTDVPRLRKAVAVHPTRIHMVQELRVRLKATNTNDAERTNSPELPDLEIRFSVDEGSRRVDPQSVRLIQKDRLADLLLPHEATDMRFGAQIYAKATSDLDPSVLDFIERSNLCVYGAKKPETPSRMTVKIPLRYLPRAVDADDFKYAEMSEGLGDSKNMEDFNEVPVDYHLAGIEHHHILVSRADQSHHSGAPHFSFSIIDAGPIGGQRQEVRFNDERDIEFAPNSSEKDGHQELEKPIFNRLYESAYELIKNLDGPKFNISKTQRTPSLRFRDADRNEIRFQRNVVSRKMSDGPMSIRGPKSPHPIRLVIPSDDTTFEAPNFRRKAAVFPRRAASHIQE
ncbi:MAG: hypothetical protein Q9176_001664 [Flavoplaca citrina]